MVHLAGGRCSGLLVEVLVESAAGVGDALPCAGEGCGGGVDVGAGGFNVGA